ncbi:MAG: DUF6067 family protein [Bacteroidaceae bacterium]
MKNSIFLLLLCSMASHLFAYDGNSQYKSFTTTDGTTYTIHSDSTWNVNTRGNHRAIVWIKQSKEPIALVDIDWRRPDLRVNEKKVIVVNATTGKEIQNVAVLDLKNERGRIAFETLGNGGKYYIYYMPYHYIDGCYEARHQPYFSPYLKPEYAASKEWRTLANKKAETLIAVKADTIESRLLHDFWSPMGIIATASECAALSATEKGNFMLFTEDRAFPIRLPQAIPYRWAERGSKSSFEGDALRNEYYTWQIGIWANQKEVKDVKVTFSNLRNGNSIISQDSLTCFNTGGIGWDGKPLTFTVNVAKGAVQALWCGVSIPRDATPGIYRGTATVSTSAGDRKVINIAIQVKADLLADRGDGDLWRHARLRWLNSQIGRNYKTAVPYSAMKIKGQKIEASGKEVRLQGNGLPQNICINGKKIFSEPLEFVVETPQGNVTFTAKNLSIKQIDDGRAEWTASTIKEGFKFVLNAFMEFDGYARYTVSLSTVNGEVAVNNVYLQLKYTPYSSAYFMGIGQGVHGGYTPEQLTWKWEGPYDSFYIGGPQAGTHIELRGASYQGPLQGDYKVDTPLSWANNGAGTVELLKHKKGEAATLIAQSGKRTLTAQPLNYEFSILTTPVRELDFKKQYSQRYYHADPAFFDEAAKQGANISTIHHAQTLNPVINYPWYVRQPLIDYINEQHTKDRKVKLYYTIRELTTQATETYAFKSLGNEIYKPGNGYGYTWPQEHLIDNYSCAWYTALPKQDADASLATSAFSRYINYYLEGLRWMLENYKIDGIYMDDVSFDRTVMQRMRKVIERYRPGALIDLHSNTGYSIGAANQYADFMPYIDRSWFGESFRYGEMQPDEWLVTFSGIPYGMMSEMLQDGGNLYLGMIYGTSNRKYQSNNGKVPDEIWKLWKDFHIDEAKMKGYWDEKPAVQTDQEQVKATAYCHKGKTLIVVGNFSKKDLTVNLKIDWKAFGLPRSSKAMLPQMGNLQKGGEIDLNTPLKIEGQKGLFILVSP